MVALGAATTARLQGAGFRSGRPRSVNSNWPFSI